MQPTVGAFAIVVAISTAAQATVCEAYRYSASASAKTARVAVSVEECRILRDVAIAELRSQYDAAVTAKMKSFDAQKVAESAVYRCTSDSTCAAARDAWKKAQQAFAEADRHVGVAQLAPSHVGPCKCSTTAASVVVQKAPAAAPPRAVPIASKSASKPATKKSQPAEVAAKGETPAPAVRDAGANQSPSGAASATPKSAPEEQRLAATEAREAGEQRGAAVEAEAAEEQRRAAVEAKAAEDQRRAAVVAKTADEQRRGAVEAKAARAAAEAQARDAAAKPKPTSTENQRATPTAASSAAQVVAAAKSAPAPGSAPASAAAAEPSAPAPRAATAAPTTAVASPPANGVRSAEAPNAAVPASADRPQVPAPAVSAVATASLDTVTATDAPYPSCIAQKLDAGSRFEDAKYFALMASDGLRSLPPKLIFNRMKVASERGETYKALFLARILSDLAPGNRAVWGNRAALAGALRLTGEAAACSERAHTLDAKVTVPSDLLPGRIAARPTTLSDWAAALAMMADGVAQHEPAAPLVAIKDDVSGIEPVMPSYEGAKPSARALAIRLEDIAPNAFILRDAKAMFTKSVNKGMLAVALLSAATMAYGSYNGVTSGMDQMQQAIDVSTAQAFAVDSRYKDGSYTTRTFSTDGTPMDKAMKPRTAGELAAVDLPFPLLWASGGSLRASFFGRLASGHGKNAETEYWDAAAKKSRKVTPPDVNLPRVASLCLRQCTPPVTVQEMLFDEEDLRSIFGDAASTLTSKMPNLAAVREAYARRETELRVAGPGSGEQLSHLVGYAGSSCYDITMKPDAWIIAAPTAAPSKR